jgi:hypothetical protein
VIHLQPSSTTIFIGSTQKLEGALEGHIPCQLDTPLSKKDKITLSGLWGRLSIWQLLVMGVVLLCGNNKEEPILIIAIVGFGMIAKSGG